MKWVFWMAAGLIAYTYVGYPIWLRMRSHWAPRPVLRGHEEGDQLREEIARDVDAGRQCRRAVIFDDGWAGH